MAWKGRRSEGCPVVYSKARSQHALKDRTPGEDTNYERPKNEAQVPTTTTRRFVNYRCLTTYLRGLYQKEVLRKYEWSLRDQTHALIGDNMLSSASYLRAISRHISMYPNLWGTVTVQKLTVAQLEKPSGLSEHQNVHYLLHKSTSLYHIQ